MVWVCPLVNDHASSTPASFSIICPTWFVTNPTPGGAGLILTLVEPVLHDTSNGKEFGTAVEHSQEPLPLRTSIIFNFARSSAW